MVSQDFDCNGVQLIADFFHLYFYLTAFREFIELGHGPIIPRKGCLVCEIELKQLSICGTHIDFLFARVKLFSDTLLTAGYLNVRVPVHFATGLKSKQPAYSDCDNDHFLHRFTFIVKKLLMKLLVNNKGEEMFNKSRLSSRSTLCPVLRQ